MVQQLMREGNCLILFLKESPMGLNARMMCRFSRQRDTKKEKRASGVNSAFLSPAASTAAGLTAWTNTIQDKGINTY